MQVQVQVHDQVEGEYNRVAQSSNSNGAPNGNGQSNGDATSEGDGVMPM